MDNRAAGGGEEEDMMRLAAWSYNEANKMRIQLYGRHRLRLHRWWRKKIPAILNWDHAVIEAAQKQTQRDFLPQQELILLEELEKKKKEIKNKIPKQHNADFWSGAFAVRGTFSTVCIWHHRSNHAACQLNQHTDKNHFKHGKRCCRPQRFDQVQACRACGDGKLE